MSTNVAPVQSATPFRTQLNFRRRRRYSRGDPRIPQARWREQTWTRKSCVICGSPSYQLHHAQYGGMPQLDLLYVVPLCAFHHSDLEVNVWPRVRKWFNLQMATLLYVVHGERLHEWLDWAADGDPPRIGVSPEQQALWGIQP